MKPYPCPECEAIAVSAVLTRDDSIREAQFCCPNGDLFTIRWLRSPLSAGVSGAGSGTIGAQLKTGPAGNRTLTAKTVRSLDG